MEITLNPFVKQILECAARLAPDNTQRRWALDRAAWVGRDLFHEGNPLLADPERRAFHLVSSPATPTGERIRPTPPRAPSQSGRLEKRPSADATIALPPAVTRILECAAALTPDHAQRYRALAQAATVGEHLFFHDANPMGTPVPRASRSVSPFHRGRTRRKSARYAQPRAGRR